MPIAIPSTVVEKHADLVSEYGSAKRSERMRHTSPSLLPGRVRAGRREAAHATVSSVTNRLQGPGLTKREFEFCRQTIKTVFQKCTDTDFLRLSVIISCLLNCFRPLHVNEITTILALSLGRDPGGQMIEDTIMSELRRKCSQILFQDEAGNLHFAHPLFAKFLLAYPVKGIDQSHTVLARACTTQVELDGGLEFNSLRTETKKLRTGIFSVYASENWQEHYRRAERGSSSLTAQVQRILWTEVIKRGGCTDCGIFEPELRREALSEVLEWCISRRFQMLSRLYRRMLIEMDSVAASAAVAELGSCGATESLATDPELDQALEQLQLTGSGSDSDSDSWSLV